MREVHIGTASLVLGVLAVLGAFVGFVPFRGWMNWGVIPFSGIGLVVGIMATAATRRTRDQAIAGLVLCTIALLVSIPRLIFGCGVF